MFLCRKYVPGFSGGRATFEEETQMRGKRGESPTGKDFRGRTRGRAFFTSLWPSWFGGLLFLGRGAEVH